MESVFHQLYSNFEYIVIDGGSADGSKELLLNHTDKIAYWVSERDKGIYDAMNKGILQAKGDYLLFLNSGDYLIQEDILTRVFSERQDADILYGELIFDFGGENKKLEKRPAVLTKEFIFADNVWHPASFIKRSLFNDLGLYNTQYKIAADYDFFFHAIAVKGVSTKYLPFPISIYDTAGMSSVPENLRKINAERDEIHRVYLQKDELIYLNHVNKLRYKTLSRWLVNKPLATTLIYGIRNLYSKIC